MRRLQTQAVPPLVRGAVARRKCVAEVGNLHGWAPGDWEGVGAFARVAQRLVALAAAVWCNWELGAPVERSLVAYDH